MVMCGKVLRVPFTVGAGTGQACEAHTSYFGNRFNKGVLLMVVVCGLVSMDERVWLTCGSHGWCIVYTRVDKVPHE